MAARLSKGEDLDLIYTNQRITLFVLFLPINLVVRQYEVLFCGWTEEMVHLPMRTITRGLAMEEGLETQLHHD